MSNARFFDFRLIATVLISLAFAFLLAMLLPIFLKNPRFMVMLPFVGLFFVALVVKPQEMLVLLLLTRPLLDNFLDLTKISVGGTQFSIGAGINLAVIILAVFLIFYKQAFPKNNIVVRWWIVFLFILGCAVLYSPYQANAARLFINQLTYAMMFLIPFLVIKRKEDFYFWLKILVLSFIVPVLFADLDMLRGGKFYADAGSRILGTFTHPNILAFYLVLGVTLYFYVLKNNQIKLKPVIATWMKLIMVNMLVLLVATKTRNAWVACFGIFFVYGLLKDKKALFLLLLLVPISLLVPSVQQRVVTVFSNDAGAYKGLNSFEWRLEMWKSSLPKIAKRPLHGYGLTSFKPMSEKFSNVGRNMGAHNVYIELLFETGAIGFISFIALFLMCIKTFFANMRMASNQAEAKLWALLIGYVVSYVVICLADNLLYYLAFNWYVWFFLGLMMVSKKFMTPDVKLVPQAQS